MGSKFNERTHSQTKIARMEELFQVIKDSRDPGLQQIADEMHIRKCFGRDSKETEQAAMSSSKPRSKKFRVDDSGTQRNARLANSVHPDNANAPNFIKGSCDNLFNGSTQNERCASDFNRGPHQRTPGFNR